MKQETRDSINLLKDFSNLSMTIQNDETGAEVKKICAHFELLANQSEMDKLRSDDPEFRRIASVQSEALHAARRIVTDVWEQAHTATLG
jgi:hypothetical protein